VTSALYIILDEIADAVVKNGSTEVESCLIVNGPHKDMTQINEWAKSHSFSVDIINKTSYKSNKHIQLFRFRKEPFRHS